jgi:hypothetical protein
MLEDRQTPRHAQMLPEETQLRMKSQRRAQNDQVGDEWAFLQRTTLIEEHLSHKKLTEAN